MDNEELDIITAFLATKEKLKDRSLFCGKIGPGSAGSKAFFFYLIEVLSPWNNSSNVFEAINQILTKTELSSDAEKCYELFEQSLIKINESLGKLSEKGEIEWIGNLNAIIGLIANDDIHISQAGTITGYMFRKGKISSITEKPASYVPDAPARTFTDVTSGKISKGDQIVFGNMELFNHISLDRLRSSIEAKGTRNSAFDLFKSFQKSKLTNINAAMFEVLSEKLDDDNLIDTSYTYYLDEPVSTRLSVTLKKLRPIATKMSEKSKEVGRIAATKGKELTKNASRNWQKKYGPETEKLIKSGRGSLSSAVNQAKSKFGLKTHKIEDLSDSDNLKVNPYAKKSEYKKAPAVPPAFEKAVDYLRLLIEPSNRKYLYALLIAIFLFIGYSKVKENNLARNQRSEARQIVDNYGDAEEAYKTASQNLALGKSTASAELQAALKLAEAAMGHDSTKDKATRLISLIKSDLDKTTKTTRIAAGTIPNIIFPSPISVSVLAGSEIYGITSEGKIYSSDTREREAKLVSAIGKENGQAVSATYTKSGEKIFIYTNLGKVLSYDIASKTFNEVKIVDDGGKWEKAKALLSYTTNLYLLDSEGGQVWKHIERDGGYSKGKVYLDTSKVNIKNSVSATIDGDIFVLQADGSVVKFIKGDYQSDFVLSGIPEPNVKIESPSEIFTDADSSSLFILDKKANRLLKFDKNGTFISQYVLDGFNIDSFVLNSRLQKIWLVAGERVFEISV